MSGARMASQYRLVKQPNVLEAWGWTGYSGNQMQNYFGILGHVPGYVTARRGLVRKFDANQPRDAQGRWEGHNTPFRAAAFKHKESGRVIETGAFHDIMAIPGMEEALAGQGMAFLDTYHQGFVTHAGQFLDRIQAAEYATAKVLPNNRKQLDSTDVSWSSEARQFKKVAIV